MTLRALTRMSVGELVNRFAELCVLQDDAEIKSQITRYNRLYVQMERIEEELGERGAEAKLQLLRLCDHKNMQVQLMAACGTFAVAPVPARRMLKLIAGSNWFPQSATARGFLRRVDSGELVPR